MKRLHDVLASIGVGSPGRLQTRCFFDRLTRTKLRPCQWLASLLILTGSAQLALAIGPDYQVMPTASVSGTPASAVVDFLTTAGATSDFGTGDIIAKYASGGQDYADVITADHVAKGGTAAYNAYIAVGANNGSAGANVYQEQFLSGPAVAGVYSNGIGGPAPASNFEDMDIVQINLGSVLTSSNVFNSITPMNILNPALYPTTLFTNVLPQYTTFTQYGYGYAGLTIVGATAGYASYDKPFNLRFQNNTVTSVVTNYTSPFSASGPSQNGTNPYSEPLIHYSTSAPPNLQLQGGGLQGDSGGPFDYLSSASVTVTNNSNVAINGTIFNDGQFAVFVGGHDTGTNYTAANFTPPGGTTTAPVSQNGDDQYGVYIDQSNYNWIMSEVPEPSSDLLVLLGGCVLVGFARRSYRRKA
jgi:PEP-CTERM motif-containing protein